MRARVIGIALRHGGRRFEIGEVIDLAEHPDLAETVGERLRARTAEPVQSDGETPADLAQAIGVVDGAVRALAAAVEAALVVAEAGPTGYPQLLLDALDDAALFAAPEGLVERFDALSERARAERRHDIEQVAPAIEAASDAAAVDGPAAASTQNSEAPEAEATGSDTAVVAQPGANPEAGDPASADGAGSTPASDDAPPKSDSTGARAATPAPRKSRSKGAKA